MFIKSIQFLCFTLLCCSVFLTSCQKDELSDSETENFEGEIDFKEFGDLARFHAIDNKCFKIVFPVVVDMPDGTIVEVDDRKALHDLLKDWKANNPDGMDRPQIAFPYDVETDGEVLTIESMDDIKDVRDNCGGPFHRKKCFRLVFPVTVEFPGGNTVEVNNRRAFYHLVKAWKANNPNADGRPVIVFPYDVQLRDGTIITVESSADFQEIRDQCHDLYHKAKCFRLVFPVSVEFPNGEVAEAVGPRKLHELIKRWKENNPDSNERPQIVFPHDIELNDGTIITVHNTDQLKGFLRHCREFYHKRRCYKVMFPLTLAFPDGTTAEVEEREEMVNLILKWKADNPEVEERPVIDFPYNVQLKDGSVMSIDSEEDKAALDELCD